ncbi:MAG: hypothetical protein KF745_13805 [Phycisphaeraceae bacterium]|nr:hypothetical protein [Phycisphaeraceae bacterium]
MDVAVGDDEAVGSEEVAGHPRCVGCEYDLHGLPRAGRCPECGVAVGESLQGGLLLRFAQPEWIRSVRWGYSVAVIGLAALAAVLVTGVAGGLGRGRAASGALWLLGIAAAAVMSVGCLAVTVPEGIKIDLVWPDAARRVLRAVSLGLIVVLLARTVPAFERVLVPWGWWGDWLTFILGVVQFLAMTRYTQWLAERVPDPWMVAGARVGVWVVPMVFMGGVYWWGILMPVAIAMWCGVAAWMRWRLGRGKSA